MVNMEMVSEETVEKIAKGKVVKQNKRGTAVFMNFSIAKEQLTQINVVDDIVARKKKAATFKLGELIAKHLDIWDDVSNSDEVLKLQARLIIVKEKDYKQMIALVNTLLADVKVDEIVKKQVIGLLTGIVA